MGLLSGTRGAKHFCTEHFSAATLRHNSAGLALEALGTHPDITAIVTDYTEVLRATPPSVRTLDEYVEFALSAVMRKMQSAAIVVIGIDHYERVPSTKSETQQQRSNRDARPPEAGYPVDDRFGVAELERLPDCKPLVPNRPMRYRMFDEMLRRVMSRIVAMNRKLEEAHALTDSALGGGEADASVVGSHLLPELVILGGDPRGADRPVDEPRRPTVQASSGRGSALFRDFDQKHPEMDGALHEVEDHLRQLADRDELAVKVIVVESIDSDHLAIALRHHAERLRSAMMDGDDVWTYLCSRERGKYASGELTLCKDSCGLSEPSLYGGGGDGVLVVDVKILHDMLLQHLLGSAWRGISPDERANVVKMLVAAWAVGGCDYVTRVEHADVLVTSLQTVLREEASTAVVRNAKEGWTTSSEARERLVPLLRRIVANAGKVLPSTLANALMRAAWTAEYFGPGSYPTDYAEWDFALPSPA